MYLATCLGHTGGVNPTFAWQRIELYAARKQSGIVAAAFVHNARKAGARKGAAKARRQAARTDVLDKEDTDKGEGPSSQPLQEHTETTLPYGDDNNNVIPSLLRDEDSIMTDVTLVSHTD
jgi:hypothetical protein